MSKVYRCDACGGTFTSEWPDADAEREAEQVFGVDGAATHPGMAEVCDDCYREIMSWLDEHGGKRESRTD